MKINGKHKDRLFRFIFGNEAHKERALELYNALNGSSYEDPKALTLTMTEGVLYMSMRNDVSFLIDTELNLWEHQSTWNPNMPLRGLLYFAQQFNHFVQEQDKDLFTAQRIDVPVPRYFVFYNGDREMGDETVMRFTDSMKKPKESCIEVTVRVLNINAGHNAHLMQASSHLREYAELVQRLKAALKGLKDSEEIRTTVDRVVSLCTAENILRDILIQNKSEVIEMFMTEYDEKETLRRIARDERQAGIEEGLEEGRKEGIAKGQTENRRLQKLAAEYLTQNDRVDEIVRLVTDDEFFADVMKEAGIDPEE